VTDIEGKNTLVLGGGGMVGTAVCRLLLAHQPAILNVAARREAKARRTVERLNAEFPDAPTHITPISGDILIRGDWQQSGAPGRAELLADSTKRRRLIADILDPIDRDIVDSSFLVQLVTGNAPGLDGRPAQLIVDCMNTATVIGYQNLYAAARDVAASAATVPAGTAFPAEVEELLAALYIPQLVRHLQLLHEGMRRAGTEAYVKVGTSGTGGMGFNIPYTHGEERPSRILLSKAALAGAHSQLLFLMARTPGGPKIVKEIKPTALIGWREIAYGPIGGDGRGLSLYDCPVDQAVSIHDDINLVEKGDFGASTGERLEAVYIDTGENGQFTAGEFAAITALDQMRLVTPEEVAENVICELVGGNTGRDIIAALDGAATGPSYRAGLLRETALTRLRELEDEHGEAVAFEILGPPRLSKLLHEANLLNRVCSTTQAVLDTAPDVLANLLEQEVLKSAALRRRIISIGVPILLSDGERLLRGPVVKSREPYYGWVDLTATNMDRWRKRFSAVREAVGAELNGDTSSRHDRQFAASRTWRREGEAFDIGEIVAWVLATEDGGKRKKN
jgi:NAD(P)-dependent dehydrogenase (short-subunit alcohol dehydrogenase family)